VCIKNAKTCAFLGKRRNIFNKEMWINLLIICSLIINEKLRKETLLPYKQRVGGSIPSAPTMKIKGLCK